jgi:hypothetical protein
MTFCLQMRVKNGEATYIDQRYKTRSLAEAKLVEIIELCYAHEPDNRPRIFEVAEFLRKALKEANEASD